MRRELRGASLGRARRDGARRGPTRADRAAGHLSPFRPPRAAVAGAGLVFVSDLIPLLADTAVDAAGLSALALVHARAPKDPDKRHVVTVTDHAKRLHLARVPGRIDLAALSPLDAVEVDGAPFVTPGPEAGLLAQYRRQREKQRAFHFAGPRSLNGVAVGDPVIRALASLPLTRDERSPIRGDVHRLATLAYAASGPMRIPVDMGAAFFGVPSAANRKRWLNAALVFDSLILRDERTGRWVTLGRAESNGRTVHLSAPFWWHGKGKGAAWRLTGALFRADAPTQSLWGRRYRRRLDALIAAGLPGAAGRRGGSGWRYGGACKGRSGLARTRGWRVRAGVGAVLRGGGRPGMDAASGGAGVRERVAEGYQPFRRRVSTFRGCFAEFLNVFED